MKISGKLQKVDLSLILTGHNEGPILRDNLKRVKRVLNDSRYSWEIILYDDASSDDTPSIFKDFAKRNKNVKAYFHSYNIGRGGTVMHAIKKTKGQIVGYIDADLELSPIYIPEAIRQIQDGADMVIATRHYSVGVWNFTRAIFTKGYIILARIILGHHFKDTEAGFKFFRRRKIIPVLNKVKDKRWFFDTEILIMAKRASLSIAEIPVLYLRRFDKISSVNLIRDSISYFIKLVTFK